jgi:thiamine-phosphate pyrophosphorylase
MNASPCRLYLITPPAFDLADFSPALKAALSGGDVAAVQLRLKPASDEAILAAGRALMPIVHGAGAALILNDRPDLAATLGADGVHIGQQDATYDEARRLLGEKATIGVTCHDSAHLAMEAGERGADYVAFGAFFPTDTKATVHRADLELIEDWSATMEIPCVAIGGITLDNAAPLVRAGADFLAVSAGVWRHAAGPGEAVRKFNDLFTARGVT